MNAAAYVPMAAKRRMTPQLNNPSTEPTCASREGAQSTTSEGLEIFDEVGLLGGAETERHPRVVGAHDGSQGSSRSVVEVGGVLPDTLQGRRPILLGGAARRVARHSGRFPLSHRIADRMQLGVRVGELGTGVAGGGFAWAAEGPLPALRGGGVEAAGRRRRCGERELVRLQGGQLAGDLVVGAVGDVRSRARFRE